ncbi:hypothetical protein BCR43DRAFT_515572 [Syncephalastrum racemosum]|uniref:Uncharacterized protein n=1 Tax=Syncephalastrum racemosum TaxID=13706 RepID=A0A1X2H9W8_SYNRA|nr:hypothetical protein BCR43DRAFT_515572 [Syncephalastrum racemosum]
MARTRKAKQISINPGFKPKPLSFKRVGSAVKKVDVNKKDATYDEELCDLQQQAFQQKLTNIIRPIKTTKKGYRRWNRREVISTSSSKRHPITRQKDNDRKNPQFKQEDTPLRSCTAELCQVLRQEILEDTELLHHVHSKFQDTMQHLTDEIHDVGVITVAVMLTNKTIDPKHLSVAVPAEDENNDYLELFGFDHQQLLPYGDGEFTRPCPAVHGLSPVVTAAIKKYAVNFAEMWEPAAVHQHIYLLIKTLLRTKLSETENEHIRRTGKKKEKKTKSSIEETVANTP